MSGLQRISAALESRPEETRSVSVVRYLDATSLGVAPAVQPVRWKWMAGAVTTGVLFGFSLNLCLDVNATAVPQHTARVDFQTSNQTVVPVPYSEASKLSASLDHSKRIASSSELEEIKARNRRLEALVQVLRQRNVTKRHNAGGGSPG